MGEAGEHLYQSHEHAIERAVAYVCRRHRLSRDDGDEFAAIVRLKLFEHDCAVLRAFQGRSSVQTYLTVVVQRLFLDYRNSRWGKWRPSAEARRLGPTAVLYERLTSRDALSPAEARFAMRANHAVTETEAEIEVLAARLPVRGRRREVSDEELVLVPGATHDGEAQMLHAEAEATRARGSAALHEAVAALPTQDRLIVQYRFEHGLQVAGIARLLRLDQKPLYRRIESILRALRGRLEAGGLAAEDVRAMFDDAGPAADPAWVARGNREERPSL